MKIILLGSNPSNASPLCDPFTHCKSRGTLDSWLSKLGLSPQQVEYMNVSNIKTPKNRPLKSHEISAALPRLAPKLEGRVVIALGKTAKHAVDMITKMPNSRKPALIVELPHPSGLNRQLNDTEWVDEVLSSAREKISQFIDFTH